VPDASTATRPHRRALAGVAAIVLLASLSVVPTASAQQGQPATAGPPEVSILEPTADGPALAGAGDEVMVVFTANRGWTYTVEFREGSEEGSWVGFDGDDATGTAERGENHVGVAVPDATDPGGHELRVRLAPNPAAPDVASDVVEDALHVTPTELPTTGFEQRGGDAWTSEDEELEFLAAVADGSPRVSYDEIGRSHEDRPVHVVRVGNPVPSDEEIAEGSSVLLIGAQHGNEPAGREMGLQLVRDLAFTDDPELLDQLGDTTVLVVPTANPDGVEANQRANAVGVDLNRDHLNLREPETRALARVLSELEPDISVDAHETSRAPQVPDNDTYMLIAWQRNLNVHPDVYDLNVAMVDDYLFPALDEAGIEEYGHFGSPDDGQDSPQFMSQVFGLRHGLGLLTESYMHGPPQARVDVHRDSMEAVLRFQREHRQEVADATSASRTDKAAQGEARSAPFYLRGADWDTQPPPSEYVLDPPPCGYLLNTAQAASIQRHVELFPLETEWVSEEALLVPMGQPMMTLVPDLLDERGRSNEVDGLPLADCTDPSSVEPPPLPPPPSEPQQLAFDFTDDEPGEVPDGWSPLWNDSEFTVLDEPRRLRHDVQSRSLGDGRQALTIDDVGDDGVVRGDVEVAALVRGADNDTLFQLGLHMSGDAANEANAFYVDGRRDQANANPSNVRLGRHQNGSYSGIGAQALPFTVSEDEWYRVVIRREDEYLHAKMWPHGEPEPEGWNLSTTAHQFDEGRVGILHFASGTVVDWAFVGVGVAGEDAPRPPEDLLG
jgi:hypothetical protein